jgi:hypothetical protein
MNPSIWTVIIAAAGVAGGIIGTIASRMGKKGDQELESVRDQFGRLLSEVNYWKESATSTRDEWETRWDRQMVRCRKVTDALVGALARLLLGATAEDREIAEKALQDLHEHNDTDH